MAKGFEAAIITNVRTAPNAANSTREVFRILRTLLQLPAAASSAVSLATAAESPVAETAYIGRKSPYAQPK